jgi:hypothetical protein
MAASHSFSMAHGPSSDCASTDDGIDADVEDDSDEFDEFDDDIDGDENDEYTGNDASQKPGHDVETDSVTTPTLPSTQEASHDLPRSTSEEQDRQPHYK